MSRHKRANWDAIVEAVRKDRLAGKSTNLVARKHRLAPTFVTEHTSDLRDNFFYKTHEEAVGARRRICSEMDFFAKRHGLPLTAITDRAGVGRVSKALYSRLGQPLGIRKDTVRKLRAAMAEIEKESKK